MGCDITTECGQLVKKKGMLCAGKKKSKGGQVYYYEAMKRREIIGKKSRSQHGDALRVLIVIKKEGVH